jgi:hypothetical protein
VGAKGIKRRKPYKRLPPPRVPDENAVVPPHIMWPARGAGFEADPSSPAGQAQRGWWFLQRADRRAPLLTAVVAWAFLALIVGSLLRALVDMLS